MIFCNISVFVSPEEVEGLDSSMTLTSARIKREPDDSEIFPCFVPLRYVKTSVLFFLGHSSRSKVKLAYRRWIQQTMNRWIIFPECNAWYFIWIIFKWDNIWGFLFFFRIRYADIYHPEYRELMLCTLCKILSRWHFVILFLFFLENDLTFRANCLQWMETICMKCHILFLVKN